MAITDKEFDETGKSPRRAGGGGMERLLDR